jgi:pimeloyl-ACP methyl ester carboxylesterase
MTTTLQRSGGILSYDDPGGTDRLIVAAPGMGDLRHVYRYLTEEGASRNLRVVTMDVRGMGESSTDWPDYSDGAIGSDMLTLIRHLDSGPAILVGNSLTAASAIIAAVQEPDSVSGLVLIGPFARNVPQPAWQSLAFRVMLAPPWGKSAWVSYYKNQMYPGDRPPDHGDYVNHLKANLSEPGRFRAFRSLAFNSHAESGSKLGQVTCPTTIIMGTADPDFPNPTTEANELAAAMNANVVLIDGAGHYPQAQAPAAVADAIEALASQVN